MKFKIWAPEALERDNMYKKLDSIGHSFFDLPFTEGLDWQMCFINLWVEHIKLLRRMNAVEAVERQECWCESCFETNAHADVCDWEHEAKCNGEGCYQNDLNKNEIDGSYFIRCINEIKL